MSVEKFFSVRLHQLRKDKGLTLSQLAKELGVSKQTVGHWETTERTPPLDKVYRLAVFFDVSVDYLIGRTDNPIVNK